MQGRVTLQETLDAIAAREYQRAGSVALGGVATPMRVAGEGLAGLIEAFAEAGSGGTEWRDRVVSALDDVAAKLLDGMQALYANVLFGRLLEAKEEPLFKLDVPSAEEIEARAGASGGGGSPALSGAASANLECTQRAFADAAALLESVVRVADTWASCADDVEKLKVFYPMAEEVAKQMMECATTLRVAAAVFRGTGPAG